MTGEAYTQISRPVNRLAEKVLGWLSWLLLLGSTVVAMFFGLVLFSNESSIQSLENSIANNVTLQEILVNNNMNATQFVIMLQNGVWAFIVYLIVCLLISFLALISINHRIISGLLFLLVTIVTLPLFFILVPLFFFIAALMMLVRREKVVLVPAYQEEGYGQYPPYEPVREHTYEQQYQNRPSASTYTTTDDEMLTRTIEQNDEETPEVLSRSAKYHHKPLKRQDDQQQPLEEDDDAMVYDSRTMARNVEPRSSQHMAQDMHSEENRTAPLSKSEERQQRKEEKKARKAYEKEQRKRRPSASSQRRQNYDDRLKLQQARSKQGAASETEKEQQ
ncbi:lipoteichoic acid stability factor AuxB [Staphylococcus lutrae]|uniref:DUF4064 domain-containing protein n=1 Tax=Staphylococcus lutrae TaxID=155085 RepID=A0AAC9WMT3_9STAP|nr:DUF4064 domain-containing protein [Staphylococcus lutrae]ARJ51542.1 hypothetical protein B5P37_09580 [Staphylococcus lutrae]PNZ39220.1 DUF4064 domain-containing protein [Staphylococcus lutrae]